MSSSEIVKWADDFMFRSESHNASEGPRVHMLHMSSDPLGQIAACAKMYKGEVVRNLSDVTDEERRYYLGEMQKTKLQMPLEAVSLHFMLENVTRAFTHQLVRQRTAAYAQESMRFAVVEDMTEAVALPPSLSRFNILSAREDVLVKVKDATEFGQNWDLYLNDDEKMFYRWYLTVGQISEAYNNLVNSGMPAEDARGLMPTNIITRINYITNLRGLLDHAGNRLCTQAQFEWRTVFAQIALAIRQYGASLGADVAWQFDEIARLLKPVCYQRGSCAFGAEFDRKCSIRERVQANAAINRPSSEWHTYVSENGEAKGPGYIPAIHPVEWLADPAAAR